MAMTPEVMVQAVERYERERDRYLKLVARVADICLVDVVKANLIRAQVTSRTKTVDSFREKLERFAKREDRDFPTVDSVFSQIGDLAGVRIAAYRQDDETRIIEELKKHFHWPNGVERDVEAKDKISVENHKFYRATHCQAALPEEELTGDYQNLRGASCEIQVCSMMAHVWNEIEHDIGYKPEGGEPGANETRLLGALGHLTRSGDDVITALLDATSLRLEALNGPFHDAYDFVARMRARLPDLDLRIGAGQFFDVLNILNLRSPEKLQKYVDEIKSKRPAVLAKLRAFNEHVAQEWDEAYCLDKETSDLLLILLLEGFAKKIEQGLPAGRAMGRPSRVRSLATRYLRFKKKD